MSRFAWLTAACLLIAACDTQTDPSTDESTPFQLTGDAAAAPRFAKIPPAPEPVSIPTEIDPALEQELLDDIARVGLVQEVLRGKERDGEVRQAKISLDHEEAVFQLEQARSLLATLSDESIPTYALLHRTDANGYLKAWLISPDGGVLTGVSTRKYKGLGPMSSGLGVRRLAISRSRAKRGEPLPSEAEIEAARAADRTPQAIEQRRATLSETAKLLLPGPIRDALGTRSGRLLVVPALDTGTAPFAALPLANGYAAENWSFVVLPDFASMAEEEPTFDFGRVDVNKAVIVGDPDLTDDRAWRWSPLPGARAEAQAVAAMLDTPGNSVLLGSDATQRRLINAIQAREDTGMVYIASHAVSHPTNPLTRGYVAMSGGHFHAGDIRTARFNGWRQNNPLVVLSACQTALGRFLQGGSFGIARTWTTAGAGQVVGSLWNVSDSATRVLMTNFVTHLKAGYAPEFAMQRAQLETLHHRDADGQQPYLRDPKLWASFTVFGRPSEAVRRPSQEI
ncbi:CHAT domain-containing protein [Parerythrobacter jejuensis]|uniref:CHAT domain-containing protein n=1 Tax=Parerythrobacter jejuensis TaxID=795812 RepID=A0A845AQP5_9SPHN|nr:CHAT domain-containing protein [Parerythrobacter jejuensis]MXP31717.1 CHAT domain-containing protein [Parerythrobacter jejuensis]